MLNLLFPSVFHSFFVAKQKEKLHGGGSGNDSNILRLGFIEKIIIHFTRGKGFSSPL